MLGIKEIALLVTAVAAVALGIAVYQRTPDRVWNRLFAVHATGGGLWVLLNYLLTVADTPYEASLYLRLTHPVVAMVICTAVDFAWVFPERIEYAAPKLRVGLYFLGALMGTVAFAPNLYHSITIEPGGIVNVVYGTAFPPSVSSRCWRWATPTSCCCARPFGLRACSAYRSYGCSSGWRAATWRPVSPSSSSRWSGGAPPIAAGARVATLSLWQV